MHEMGIANSVLAAVRKEVERHPGAHPCRVGVRIGEMSALDQDALRFCFEAMTRETDLEFLQLEIEICPFRYRCCDCGEDFVVRDYQIQCPGCASMKTEFLSGDELELAYLEVEDGTSTPATKSAQ